MSKGITLISAESGLSSSYIKDLWKARVLLRELVRRDLRAKYKQTLFGRSWVVLNPLFTAAVYSFLFGYIARFPSDGVPYPLFLFVALLPWFFISRLVTEGAQSVAQNTNLVGKVYFPRLVLPLALLGSLLVDLFVGFAVAFILAGIYGIFPGIQIMALPLFIGFALMVGLAGALILAPLDVAYRDLRQVLPLLLQITLYVSPVLYSGSLVPERFRWIYEMNPIAVIATGVRWSMFGQGDPPSLVSTGVSVAIVIPLLALGLWLFVRAEPRFADQI